MRNGERQRERREPERTVLYRAVQSAWRTFVSAVEVGERTVVFPSRNGDGEMAPVRTPCIQKYEKGTKMDAIASPHRLRHTFASACHEAYLREIDLKILMNHTLPGQDKNVPHGYVHPSLGHLRGCVEKVAKFLLKKAGLDAGSGDQKRRVG